MVNASDKIYRHSYHRLYGWLNRKHPEIIKQYQEEMKQAKDKAAGIYELSIVSCVQTEDKVSK